jgi:hypothetical protein
MKQNYLGWAVGVIITGALIGTGIYLANKYVLNKKDKYGWSSAVGGVQSKRVDAERRY